MFFNEVNSIQNKNDTPDPGHYPFDFSNGLDASILLFVFLPLVVFGNFNNWLMKKFIKFINLAQEIKICDDNWEIVINIDEDLGNYWNCLPGIEQKTMYVKELHMRETDNIKQLDDA